MTQPRLFKTAILNNSGFLLLVIFISRIAAVFSLDCTPPMEGQYIFMAEKLFAGHDRIFISFAPGYSGLLYIINLIIGNYKTTSFLVYAFSSTLFSYVIFRWLKEKYSAEAGIISLWILLFFPNSIITYTGYSHCVTAALFFLTLSAYRFWKLWRNETTLNHITFIAPSVCAIALRPELILTFIFLMACFYLFRLTKLVQCKKSVLSWRLLLFPVIVFAFTWMHRSFVQNRNINGNTSAFSDSFYSYRSFISVYCFKQGEIFTDSLSVRLSTPHFGTPQENNNSIFKAIARNPLEVGKNATYNFTQALKLIAHPLVIPFYLLLFSGSGLFYKSNSPLTPFNLYLLAVAVVPTATLFLFIVTIKYLSAVTIPVVILSAYGISKLENEKMKKTSVVILAASFLVISLVYFISFLQAGARG